MPDHHVHDSAGGLGAIKAEPELVCLSGYLSLTRFSACAQLWADQALIRSSA